MVNLMGPPPQQANMLNGIPSLVSAQWALWFNQIANSIAGLDNLNGGGNSGGTGQNGTGPGLKGIGFTTVVYPGNFGLKLDGVTDDSLAFQTLLNTMGQGTCKLISPNLGMYTDSFVAANSFQTIDMTECPWIKGPSASLGTNGQYAETPTGGGGAQQKPHLFANIAAGATSFNVVIFSTNISPAAGNEFELRGQRTVTGQVPDGNRESGFISSAVNTGISTGGGIKWTITPLDPIQNSYSVEYTGDPYEIATGLKDFSAFTLLTYFPFTSNVAAGTDTIVLGNVTGLNIGDWVFVSDRQTVGSATGITDVNPINNEINRVADIDVGTNTIYLQQRLNHSYLTAYNAGITTLAYISGVRLIGVKATFGAADSDAKNYGIIFRNSINCYAYDCKIGYATIGGVNYGQYGEAFRMQNCFSCHFFNCDFAGKPDQSIYPSAQGYGLVQVGCTCCSFVGGAGYNARHDVLIQDGSCDWLVIGRIINDPRISGIDTHGINAVNGRASDCIINGGPLFSPDSTNKAAIRMGNSAHIYGDFNNVIENITINNFAYSVESGAVNVGFGIDFVVESGGNTVRNVVINGCDYGVNSTVNSTFTTAVLGPDNLAQNIIVKNAALGVTQLVGGSSNVIGGLVLDNVISDGNSAHFVWTQLYKIKLINSKIINSIATTNTPSVQSTSSTAVQIIGNDFDGANEGVYIEECPGAQVINNNMRNQLQSTVFKDNTAAGNNNGYVFTGNSYAGTSNPTKSLGGSTGTLKDNNFQNINAQTGTAYTFAQIDESNVVTGNNAGSQTYTIPTNATIPFQIGAKIDVASIGAGTITIAGASGVTYAGSTVVGGAAGSIKKIAANTWI